MHFADGCIPAYLAGHQSRKVAFICLCGLALAAALLASIAMGAADISVLDVAKALLGRAESSRHAIIVWKIRFPQALSAMVTGAGLAVCGAAMQSILRNPLGSPFTLGLSQAAALGAAFSVMILGSGAMSSSQTGSISITDPAMTTVVAFVFSLGAAAVILSVFQLRNATPEAMILTGVAIGSLCTAGTMFLQYFADDVQLAAMVFWTFGDVARADWQELAIMSVITAVALVYFLLNAWNYNAIDSGDETAKGLGVRVNRVRIVGMLMASVVTSTLIAFLGIIGFVGLVVPHMVRRVIGSDHRFVLPACIVVGALLLLVSDTVARLILAPHIVPVAILTAFLGAPLFLYLIMKGARR
jgi:iron complex transport system permease protein